MEKFDSAYLAYLCVWFQNITYYYVKHFIPIYVGLKLITILWINIQKGLPSSSLLFSCRAKRLNRGASVPPQQGVKIPVWWYSPTPNNATLTKQSMMIYHAIGREEKLKFPLHLFLGITCTRRKKPITLFYEYLKISFTLYLHVPEH